MNDKLSNKRVKFSIGYVIAAVLIMALIQQFISALNRLAAKLCAQETVDGDEVAAVLAETVRNILGQQRRFRVGRRS